ncbi:Stress responsive alpha-beta barrel domain-containing protein [uncultured Paludibacter sp.]|nr:Stress responsive alpha-beta barrel domain-containing protein [uncultured Paludibacter sp.]
MIKHIVFFQLAEQAEGKNKSENAQIIKDGLENLINLIPQLKKIEVGINHPKTPSSNYDVSLYSEFDSLEDLNIYQEHPEHKKIGSYIVKVKTDRVCVDYEV